MISPLVSSSVVIIRVMTVVRTGAGRFAYLHIGICIADDIPEPVLVLLDPDDAAAVGAGRDQEDPDIVGFLGCAGKDQRVIFGRHAVAVFGTRSRGETPEDVVAGGVLQTACEGHVPLAAFPAGISVHDVAQHLGGFRPATGLEVAEDGVKIHFDSALRAPGNGLATRLELAEVRGQSRRGVNGCRPAAVHEGIEKRGIPGRMGKRGDACAQEHTAK